jgi:superoxide reductase
MTEQSELIKSADWKSEKHVPMIECADAVKANAYFEVKVTLGKAIAHPNTTEHHIRWIQLGFQEEGTSVVFQIGTYEFTAHGESVAGPNEGSVYTQHEVVTSMKTGTSGTLHALAYCNIHGMWQSSKTVKLL